MADMVKRSEFRSDLYYRLNVFPIPLPPLRARREDLPALVEHFVEVYARRMDKQIEHIPPETMSALSSYQWPGNIRELQNFIERSVILSSGDVLRSPLANLKSAAEAESLGAITLEDAEREHIRKTLEHTHWVVAGPTGQLHVWESRGLRFTSGCKSLASHAPRESYFRRIRVEMPRSSTLQSIDPFDSLAIGRATAHISGLPESAPCRIPHR